MRTVLFVQGAGDMHHREGSGHLAAFLKRELGDDYRVRAPEMPEADSDPRFGPWRDRIAEELAAVEGPVLIVGHSFGASVVLKALAEGLSVPLLEGLFLVAMPDWSPAGWDVDAFRVPDDVASKLPDVPIYLYQSRDDPQVPFDHLALDQALLPNATARPIDGSEHSFTEGLPELVQDIRQLER
jgi:uncharacterized protein